MVAILYKQTQNVIWLLYYINKHKTRYGCYIIYTNTKRDMVAILYKQNAIWLLYYINKTRYGCYII